MITGGLKARETVELLTSSKASLRAAITEEVTEIRDCERDESKAKVSGQE